MIKLILKKLGSVIPLLLFISIILFVMLNLLPGNAMMGLTLEATDPEYIEMITKELGLDKPLHERYFDWITGVLRGDFGNSFVSRRPVILT